MKQHGHAAACTVALDLLGGRGAQLFLLTIAAAAAAYARATISPLQEVIQAGFGVNDNRVALLQGPVLAMPMMLAAVPLGLTIDRYSRVRVIFILAMIDVIGGLLSALVPTFYLLLAVRSFVGLTAPATAMTALSVIADFYAPGQRGRANMVMAVGQVGGMSAAFAVGGELLSVFGSGPAGWRWSIAWMNVPLGLVALLALAMREPPRTGLAARSQSPLSAFVELWQFRRVIGPLLTGQVMVGMADAAVLVWAAPTLSRSFGLRPDRIGVIMAIVLLVSGVLGPIAGGVLADLSQRAGGPRRTTAILAGLSVLSVPTGLFAIVPAVAWAGALLVTFMTIGYAISVIAGTLFTVVIPSELRGLCIATSVTASLLFCLGVAPVAVSALSNTIGGPSMIGESLAIACVTISLLGAAIFWFGARNFPGGYASKRGGVS